MKNLIPQDLPDDIDGYKIIEFLGEGAYGYGLKVKKDDRELFLKIVKPDALVKAKERTENEIWAIKRTQGHSAFVEYVDDGALGQRRYYVSTLARGITIREIQKRHFEEHGTPIGPRLMAVIGIRILDALLHLKEKGVNHRDLKDDNITATEAGNDITIVDFGSCKGESTPVKDLTWLNPGATRFSPPTRDDRPSYVHPTHDVYSVAVMLYSLLTNRFPFEVCQREGPVELTAKKKSHVPLSIWELNSHVPSELSEWILRLLTPRDEDRMEVEEALRTLRSIKEEMDSLASSKAIVNSATGRIRLPEVVRDPLHGDIRLTDLEYKIIHTPEFVRLRKVRQLGFAYIPYPGAEHRRHLHSLGTLHVTSKILESIENISGYSFALEDKLLARAYALLHDITHIPFGHTLEDELSLFSRHDENESRIGRMILEESSPLGLLLLHSEIQKVRDFFQRDRTVMRLEGIREILTAAVGADVLDYIDRDSFFCGLDHRIDSAIFRRFRLRSISEHEETRNQFYLSLYGSHGLRLDAEFASETVFIERFSLYLKVYTHPKKIAAGAMLGKALWEHSQSGAKLDEVEGELETKGDTELLYWLASPKNRASVSEIARMLIDEQLYEPVYRCNLLKREEWNLEAYRWKQQELSDRKFILPADREEKEKSLAKKVTGVSAKDIILYCPANAQGYNKVRQWVETEEGRFEERRESHSMHCRVRERHLGLWNAYIFCHPKLTRDQRLRIANAAYELFGIENAISQDRQKFLLL